MQVVGPVERRAHRQEQSLPILADFKRWLDEEYPAIEKQAKAEKAEIH